MKKPTLNYKKWHANRARNEARRRRSKSNYFFYWGLRLPPISKMALDTKRYGIPYPAPEVVCLDENYDEVVQFISKVRSVLIVETDEGSVPRDFGPMRRSFRYHNSYGDFRKIKKITSAAALLLAAEFDRVRRVSGIPLYTIDLDEWNPNVREVLKQLGFLRLLNVAEEEVPTSLESTPITVLPFSTGRKTEGAKATEIVNALNPLFGKIDDPMGLRDCVVEAMSNVTRHAYPEGHHYIYTSSDKRWWLTGSFNSDKNKLSVVFVDLGVTIPVSLPNSNVGRQAFAYLKKVFRLAPGVNDLGHDAEQIQAATHTHETSTDGSGAGLGLAEMKDFVDASKNGRLKVLSRRGEYIYEKGAGETIVNHVASIGGTLIEWEISR